MYRSLDDAKKAIEGLFAKLYKEIPDKDLQTRVYAVMLAAFGAGSTGNIKSIHDLGTVTVTHEQKGKIQRILNEAINAGNEFLDYMANRSSFPASEAEELCGYFLSLGGGDVKGFIEENRKTPLLSKCLKREESEKN